MERIRAYFANLGLPEYSRQLNISGFERHPDIAEEFSQWLMTHEYPSEHPIKVEGYTAKEIAQMAPMLNGPGAYNFLITLREKPDKAKRYISEGFKRK